MELLQFSLLTAILSTAHLQEKMDESKEDEGTAQLVASEASAGFR
jgi:hypothetical protein